MLKGSKGRINTGGQIFPISCTGTRLWWKKAQNQAKKNKTSLKIKRPIPHFKPSWTFIEWSPTKQPSRVISRHHKKDKKKIKKKDKKILKKNFFLKKIIKEVIIKKTKIPFKKGQGLKETIWKEWKSFIILIFRKIKK